MPSTKRLCLGASMRFDHADHDIDAGLLPRRAFGQHFVGLADARSRAEEDLQTTATLLRCFAKEGLGRRSVWVGVHFADFALKPSSCRLSARTLTCASPIKPSVGPVTDCSTSVRTCPSDMPRALATRGTWAKAFAGEMSGSRPDPDAVTMSAGTAPVTPSARAWSTPLLMLSASCFEVGPRFEPDEADAS